MLSRSGYNPFTATAARQNLLRSFTRAHHPLHDGAATISKRGGEGGDKKNYATGFPLNNISRVVRPAQTGHPTLGTPSVPYPLSPPSRHGFSLSLAGLKFDDLMMEEDPDVAEAVRRLTPAQQLARKRRQLRAFDISLKKTPLPDHIQAVQEPFEVRVCMCVYVCLFSCNMIVLLLFEEVVFFRLWWGEASHGCEPMPCEGRESLAEVSRGHGLYSSVLSSLARRCEGVCE